MTQKQLVAVAIATACAGITTGALTFASFCDVRSFLAHLDARQSDLVVSHFQVWWPNGRDFMVPLLLANIVAHGTACGITGDPLWAATGAAVGLILPYTGLVLGGDIVKLRKASPEDADKTARRFCALHHVRSVMAAASFGLSLFGMGRQFAKSGM